MCGCDALVLSMSPTGRWDPALRGGSPDPHAERCGGCDLAPVWGPPQALPAGASWSQCTGWGPPAPAPAGTRGSVTLRSVGLCAGAQDGEELLVLFWPEDADSEASGLLLLMMTPPV